MYFAYYYFIHTEECCVIEKGEDAGWDRLPVVEVEWSSWFGVQLVSWRGGGGAQQILRFF